MDPFEDVAKSKKDKSDGSDKQSIIKMEEDQG